jgi:hypothetical protein
VAAYGFNEGSGTTTADASGNGNTATLFGATWTTGKYGQGLAFNGTNQYVAGRDIDFASGPFTVSGWFKAPAVGFRYILAKYNSTDGIYVFISGSGRLWVGLQDGNNWQEVSTSGSVADNVWHHFAMVVSTTDIRLYVDGAFTGTARSHDNSFPVNNLIWNIGRVNDGTSYFNGNLDEIKFYNKALTAAEVVTDMNTPVP